MHPVTGETITKYKQLERDPTTQKIWQRAMSIDLGRLSQGFLDTPGTNTIRFMAHNIIKTILKNKRTCYIIHRLCIGGCLYNRHSRWINCIKRI